MSNYIQFHPIQTLHWRHNDHSGVSNHQPRGCLLNCLFRRRSKKTSKLRVTGLCVGNSPGPVNSPHKGPVTRKMFPFDDVIMNKRYCHIHWLKGRSQQTWEIKAMIQIHSIFHHKLYGKGDRNPSLFYGSLICYKSLKLLLLETVLWKGAVCILCTEPNVLEAIDIQIVPYRENG